MTMKKEYIQLLNFLKPYWKSICLAIVCLLLGSILSIIPPLLVKRLIDTAVPTKDIRLFIILIVGIFALPILTALIQLGQYYFSSLIGYRILLQLRRDMFDKLLALPASFFLGRKKGEILSRINDDTGTIQTLIGEIIFPGIQILSGIAFSIPIMLYINWKLAIIGIAAYPITILPSNLIGKRMKYWMRLSQEKKAEVTSFLNEALHGMKTIKAFSAEKKEALIYQEKNNHLVHVSLKSYILTILNSVLFNHMVQGLTSAIIYSIGIWFIMRNEFSVGGLMAFTAYMPLIYASLTQLTRLNPAIQQQMVSLERVNEYMEIPIESQAKDGHELQGNIELKNVSFRYPRVSAYTLDNISLKIKAGEFIALVGPSGAGKSTIVDLLLGFYKPEKGRIVFDGISSGDISLSHLRKQIGVVSQDLFLFHRSVRDNICYGVDYCGEAEIIEAAKAANIHEYIKMLPDQYQTIIQEDGESLSGGEKQRIAIARAILRKPKILILDEATSDLDTLTEKAIQNALMALKGSCTIIAIAHRLSTVLDADCIYVISDGRIVERGTYDELKQERGLFAQLYQAQFPE